MPNLSDVYFNHLAMKTVVFVLFSIQDIIKQTRCYLFYTDKQNLLVDSVLRCHMLYVAYTHPNPMQYSIVFHNPKDGLCRSRYYRKATYYIVILHMIP